MNERQRDMLILLRFVPHILIVSIGLFSFLLVWAPINPSALLLATAAGIWGFVTIALQIRTGWWFGIFGLAGWLGFLKASTSQLGEHATHSLNAAFCLMAFGMSVWMALLLAFRRAFRRYLASAEGPKPVDTVSSAP